MSRAAKAAKNRRRTPREYEHLVPLFDQLASLKSDDPHRNKIRNELVIGYLPLAKHIAQRYSGRGTPHDDLVQVATVGLIKAIDRFQPDHGNDFLSFAVPTVMGEVRRYFRDATWSMRVPRRLKELHLAVEGAATTLAQHLGRAPTPAEIAEHLNISKEEVYHGIEAGQGFSTSSLDEPAINEVPTLGESISENDKAMERVENHEMLRPLITALPPLQQRILALRFFHNMTQTQIAEQVGFSQMHISRLLSRALAQLRDGATHSSETEPGNSDSQTHGETNDSGAVPP